MAGLVERDGICRLRGCVVRRKKERRFDCGQRGEESVFFGLRKSWLFFFVAPFFVFGIRLIYYIRVSLHVYGLGSFYLLYMPRETPSSIQGPIEKQKKK